MNEQQNENNRTIEIDLGKFLRACLKRWWIFLVVMGYLAVVVYGATKFFVEPTYKATTKIYVNNSQMSQENQKITTTDINAATALVKLYSVFLNTNDTLSQIIATEYLPYTPNQLKKMMETAAVNDTQVFAVTVTSTSPEEAKRIAEAVADILPEKIKDTVSGADAKVVERAALPTAPSGPRSLRNAFVGALIGFVLVGFAIMIHLISDTTIHDEIDIEELTKIPILVSIPDIVDGDKKKRKSGKYYYASAKEEK